MPRDENGMAYEFHEILTTPTSEREHERSPLRTGLKTVSILLLTVIALLKYDLIAK